MTTNATSYANPAANKGLMFLEAYPSVVLHNIV